MAGCGGGARSAPEQLPPEVGVANVVSRSVRAWDEFNGRISAIQEVQLRPRVSGYIDRVAYREGDEVRAGDLLFVIDPRP
jgi:multidrug efflux system membrane fusion protein